VQTGVVGHSMATHVPELLVNHVNARLEHLGGAPLPPGATMVEDPFDRSWVPSSPSRIHGAQRVHFESPPCVAQPAAAEYMPARTAAGVAVGQCWGEPRSPRASPRQPVALPQSPSWAPVPVDVETVRRRASRQTPSRRGTPDVMEEYSILAEQVDDSMVHRISAVLQGCKSKMQEVQQEKASVALQREAIAGTLAVMERDYARMGQDLRATEEALKEQRRRKSSSTGPNHARSRQRSVAPLSGSPPHWEDLDLHDCRAGPMAEVPQSIRSSVLGAGRRVDWNAFEPAMSHPATERCDSVLAGKGSMAHPQGSAANGTALHPIPLDPLLLPLELGTATASSRLRPAPLTPRRSFENEGHKHLGQRELDFTSVPSEDSFRSGLDGFSGVGSFLETFPSSRDGTLASRCVLRPSPEGLGTSAGVAGSARSSYPSLEETKLRTVGTHTSGSASASRPVRDISPALGSKVAELEALRSQHFAELDVRVERHCRALEALIAGRSSGAADAARSLLAPSAGTTGPSAVVPAVPGASAFAAGSASRFAHG